MSPPISIIFHPSSGTINRHAISSSIPHQQMRHKSHKSVLGKWQNESKQAKFGKMRFPRKRYGKRFNIIFVLKKGYNNWFQLCITYTLD